MTTTTGTVVADIGITWRQLDYWIRRGWVTLDTPGKGGSGNRRTIHPAEAAAINDTATAYATARQLLADIAAGDYYADALRRRLEETP